MNVFRFVYYFAVVDMGVMVGDETSMAEIFKHGNHFQPGNPGGRPPKGNRNHMRHGLTAGKLPLDCAHVEIACNNLRRQLEDAVISLRGEVTLLEAATIQTCLKWERHGALALRWLRVQGDKLKPNEQLVFSREIARASTERDKALAALNLKADKPPWLMIEEDKGNERDKA